VETTPSRDELVARAQKKVIRVRQDNLRSGLLELAMAHGLDRALGANGHERGRLDDTVWCLKLTEPGVSVGRSNRETESAHTLRYRFR
jgi:hypothetical protein